MFGAKNREIARLKHANATLHDALAQAGGLSRTALGNVERLAQQQAKTFEILAVQIDAARQLGRLADAQAVADDLVEQLEAVGFGPELEFATARYCRQAGEQPC